MAAHQLTVLVFGGSFNPPTVAHQALIAACLAKQGFDQVWLMPSGERLDKQPEATDAQRLDMLRIIKTSAFDNDHRLVVSDFELRLPRPSQTSKTVSALQRAYPHTDFWFAFGEDAYRDIPNWPGGAELKNLKTIIFPRTADVSSTAARTSIAAGQNKFVTQPVLDYILQHQLYT